MCSRANWKSISRGGNNLFTKRKFLQLPIEQQHKKCAEILRAAFEDPTVSLEPYHHWLSWMKLLPFESIESEALSDRYHWHLDQAHQSLKEHNLLPALRSGDHVPKADFLPIAIYLDNVRSAYNVGSILRTCEAMRLGRVYFSGHTPFYNHEKVLRTAMGAAPLVPCFQDVPLSELPRPIIALDTSDQAIPLGEFLFPPAFTLVLGNEEYGISHASLSLADTIVEIPLCGMKNSLNVACAFAIAAHTIRRQISNECCDAAID